MNSKFKYYYKLSIDRNQSESIWLLSDSIWIIREETRLTDYFKGTVEPRQYGHEWAKKKIGSINGVPLLTRVFYKKMYGDFCQAAKKSGRNNEVTVLPRCS